METGHKMSQPTPGILNMKTVFRCTSVMAGGMMWTVYRGKAMYARNLRVSMTEMERFTLFTEHSIENSVDSIVYSVVLWPFQHQTLGGGGG